MADLTKLAFLAIGFVTVYIFRPRRLHKRTISDEKILVVGASSGVGLEIAREYAQQRGKDISLHLVARKPLDKICKDLQDSGIASVTSTQADVSDPADVHKLVQEVHQTWSRVDTIIIWSVTASVTLKRLTDESQKVPEP